MNDDQFNKICSMLKSYFPFVVERLKEGLVNDIMNQDLNKIAEIKIKHNYLDEVEQLIINAGDAHNGN